jgi:WD40 repeat protein
LYYAASHQEYKVMDHGESVRFISFKPKSHLMATCGMKMVKVWDIRSGEAVCSLKSPPRPLGIEFIGDLLLVASHKNYIASWDTGQNASPEMSQRPWSDKPETNHMGPRQPPCALSLSASHGMLAVAYSSQPITLWDLKEDAYFGSCGKKLSSGETSTHIVVSLAFNPNPNIGLLAIAYLDGDLALLDPFADQQLECFRANCQTLAPSPNGRLLAAGGQNGIIHIYEFDTFKLLYRVKSSNSYIKQLGFARDNLRLADIRGAQCTVWEPEALLRDSLSDDSSGTTSSSTSMVETVTVDAKAKITAMVLYPTADVLFCGKDDGTVVLYNSKTARPLRTICRHKSPVRLLVWCERKSALLSVDAFNRILLHGIQMSASKNPSADVTVLFESRLESEKTIVDVLVGEAMSKYLLSTRESDHILDLESGEHEIERTYPDMPGTRKWLQCPQSSQHLVCLCDVSARVYCWADWSEIRCFPFSLNTGTVQLKNATFYSLGQEQRIMLELLDRNSLISSRSIEIFDAGCLTPQNHHGHSLENQSNTATTASPSATDNDRQNTTASLCPAFSLGLQPVTFASSVAHVIGINKLGRFVFIDHSSWVCSVDLSNDVLKVEQGEGLSIIEIVRHFFVPFDWFAGARDVVCTLAINDIMLTRGGDLVIIRGAFDYAEKVSL